MSQSQLVLLPLEAIEPCPIQPRVNFSVDLIRKLSASMKAGRHDPLLEVEPQPGTAERYQIVCGEQRWRAAKEAGLREVLVRLHPPLGYLERLEKQYEENRLRSDLDPIEEAHCCLLDKTLRDIAVAERLLQDALVPFRPLDDKRIGEREEFAHHLDDLKRLLVRKKVHTIKSGEGRFACGPLAPWRETEQALGISEAARKRMLAILRIDPELQEAGRELPAQHLVEISRLPDPARQAELLSRASALTHEEVRRQVEHLLGEPPEAEDSSDPGQFAFEARLEVLADLCRQLVRALGNLGRDLSADDRARVREALSGLRPTLAAFEEVG